MSGEHVFKDLKRQVARDFGAMSPMALQVNAMQAALDRKDQRIADLERQNASLYAAVGTLEGKILRVVSETRLGLAVEKLVDHKNGDGK